MASVRFGPWSCKNALAEALKCHDRGRDQAQQKRLDVSAPVDTTTAAQRRSILVSHPPHRPAMTLRESLTRFVDRPVARNRQPRRKHQRPRQRGKVNYPQPTTRRLLLAFIKRQGR